MSWDGCRCSKCHWRTLLLSAFVQRGSGLHTMSDVCLYLNSLLTNTKARFKGKGLKAGVCSAETWPYLWSGVPCQKIRSHFSILKPNSKRKCRCVCVTHFDLCTFWKTYREILCMCMFMCFPSLCTPVYLRITNHLLRAERTAYPGAVCNSLRNSCLCSFLMFVYWYSATEIQWKLRSQKVHRITEL